MTCPDSFYFVALISLVTQTLFDDNCRQLDKLSGCDANRSMAPQFTMRPRDRRVQVTFPVRLTCQVMGFPKPDVNWLLNQETIAPTGNYPNPFAFLLCHNKGNFFTCR